MMIVWCLLSTKACLTLEQRSACLTFGGQLHLVVLESARTPMTAAPTLQTSRLPPGFLSLFAALR